MKFPYIKVYSIELDIVMLRFYCENWMHYVKEILKNICMFFVLFFLFLLTHNVYIYLGFSKKLQNCNLQDECLGLFTGLKLQFTLAGWLFVMITWHKLSPSWNFQTTSKEDIFNWMLLFHVYFELNNNINNNLITT